MDNDSLIMELDLLRNEVKNAEFVNPKSIRRIEEIRSLLITSGESSNINIVPSKPKGSRRGHCGGWAFRFTKK